jgi:hypothetical protein
VTQSFVALRFRPAHFGVQGLQESTELVTAAAPPTWGFSARCHPAILTNVFKSSDPRGGNGFATWGFAATAPLSDTMWTRSWDLDMNPAGQEEEGGGGGGLWSPCWPNRDYPSVKY